MKIIYQNESGGVSVVMPTGELPIDQVIAKDVPEGALYKVIDASELPADQLFFEAWILTDDGVDHDMDKCKCIAHDMRRAARAEEFEPLDNIIAKQIPGMDAVAAEDGRKLIRKKYAKMQKDIDAAVTPEEIKTALGV